MPGASWVRRWTLSLFIGQFLVSMAAFGQSQQVTTVSGSFGFHVSATDNATVTFNCIGAPFCAGTYTVVERAPQCTNQIVWSAGFMMTALNLAQSGTLSGTITMINGSNTLNRNPNGTCTINPGAVTDNLPYTATWNLATRTGTINVNGGE